MSKLQVNSDNLDQSKDADTQHRGQTHDDDVMSSSSSSENGGATATMTSGTSTNGSVLNAAGGGDDDDDAECEKRRVACLADMRELEQLFARLKDALLKEKQCLIEAKLREIEDESADEFTHTVLKMKQNMETRIRLATLLRDYKLSNAQHFKEYEEMCLKHSLLNDKTALLDRHVAKIESEIIQLEERRRQLNLDYNIWQLMQAERTGLTLSRGGGGGDGGDSDDFSCKLEQDNRMEEDGDDNRTGMVSAAQSNEETIQQQPLRKSTRNKSATSASSIAPGESASSSNKTSASSSGIWSSNGELPTQFYAPIVAPPLPRHVDPDAAPYIVYSLSDYEILEDWSILKMHKSLNSRLNRV